MNIPPKRHMAVTARVMHYRQKMDFGFATIVNKSDSGRHIEVRFHQNDCHEVGANSLGELELTDRKITAAIVGTGINASMLLAYVTPSQRGRMTAIAWGVLPKQNCYNELIRTGDLTYYVGGEFYDIGNTTRHSHPGITDHYGTLQEIELTEEAIRFTLAGPQQWNSRQAHYKPEDQDTRSFTYGLEFSALDARPQFGNIVIYVYDNYGVKRQLVFYRP